MAQRHLRARGLSLSLLKATLLVCQSVHSTRLRALLRCLLFPTSLSTRGRKHSCPPGPTVGS